MTRLKILPVCVALFFFLNGCAPRGDMAESDPKEATGPSQITFSYENKLYDYPGDCYDFRYPKKTQIALRAFPPDAVYYTATAIYGKLLGVARYGERGFLMDSHVVYELPAYDAESRMQADSIDFCFYDNGGNQIASRRIVVYNVADDAYALFTDSGILDQSENWEGLPPIWYGKIDVRQTDGAGECAEAAETLIDLMLERNAGKECASLLAIYGAYPEMSGRNPFEESKADDEARGARKSRVFMRVTELRHQWYRRESDNICLYCGKT